MNEYHISILICVGLISSVIGGMYYITYSSTENLKNVLFEMPLEAYSCETIVHYKSNFERYGKPLFYDSDKIIKVLKQKWDLMDCSNDSSQYWRGEDWTYSPPQKPRTELFKENESDYMDDLYDSWEKKP